KVTITPRGAVEIADCGLWSMTWPGANLAFVKPAGAGAGGTGKPPAKDDGDDLLAELGGNASDGLSGKMKDCRGWWPNTDPDRTQGHFLRSPVDRFTMVDGKRYGNGQARPWSSGKSTSWGASLTIEFGKPAAELSLVGAYERSQKQSQVSRNLMVFSGVIK